MHLVVQSGSSEHQESVCVNTGSAGALDWDWIQTLFTLKAEIRKNNLRGNVLPTVDPNMTRNYSESIQAP